MNEETLDFILIGQKDKLINRIDNAKSSQDLVCIKRTLSILQPLWNSCNYTYKHTELQQRITNKQNTFRSIKP